MKLQLSIDKQLFVVIVALGIIGSLGFSSMQSAFADPDPSQGYLQATIVQTSVADIQIDQAAANVLTVSNHIYVYEVAKSTAQAAGSAGLETCPVTVGVVDSWELVRASDDAKIGYKFLGGGALGQVKVQYGTGVGTTSGNTVLVIPNADTDLRFNGIDAGSLGTSVAAYWKITQGANVINTDNLGVQSFLSCGTEGTGVTPPTFIGGGQVEIVKPVGGEIISVSTTALLLAGASTSALWLVPLAAIAAGAFAVLRFQVYRK